MKKFNFFPVLLVAFLMLCGFSMNAQTYKSPAQALESVQNVIDQSTSTLNASNATTIVAGQNLAQMVLRIELGTVLMPKIKQSQNVEKSLTDMYASYTSNDPRTLEMRAALDHIKTQLLN
jgi:hypothetical protein